MAISFYHTVSAEDVAEELMSDNAELGECLVRLGEGCDFPQELAKDMSGSRHEIEQLTKLRNFIDATLAALKENGDL